MKFFSRRPSLLLFLPAFTVWNLIYSIYDPFLNEKPLFHKKFLHLTFFGHFVLFRSSLNTTSPNIGGTDGCMGRPPRGDGCMGRPPPQILERPSPPAPLSLRPCLQSTNSERSMLY